MDWIISNLATILICLVLATLLTLAVVSIIRNHTKSGNGCSCGCSGCSYAKQCGSRSKEEENKITE
jgi:hypothetical protein